MNKIKLDKEKRYNLIKLHEDGKKEVKVQRGYLETLDGTVKVDEVVRVWEGRDYYWQTSLITGIEKTGKGIMFETLNSTYILEEVD